MSAQPTSSICVRLSALLLTWTSAWVTASQDSLYWDTPQVLDLNYLSYERTVYNDPYQRAFFVQFYKPTCGHCRHFAPTFKEFARDVVSWRNSLQLVVVSCGDTNNLALCRTNNVTHTPFFRYVYKNARSLAESVEVDIHNDHRTTPGVRAVVAGQVDRDSSITHNWPQLEYLDPQTTLDVAWTTIPANVHWLVVVIQERDTPQYDSTQLTLALSGYLNVAVRRARSNSVLSTQLHSNQLVPVLNYPKVSLVQRNNPMPRIKPTTLSAQIMPDLLSAMQAVTSTTNAPSTTTRPSFGFLNDAQQASLFYVSESDMLLATKDALYNEVLAFRQTIAGDDLIALKKFYSLLKDYFPIASGVEQQLRSLKLPPMQPLPRSQRARRFFAAMHALINQIPNDGQMTIANYKQQFEYQEALAAYPFPTQKKLFFVKLGFDSLIPHIQGTPYTHCKGSSPEYRGFTCGLWTTFHVITVQAFLSRSADMAMAPTRPLYAIQQWVSRYFSCAECRSHFMNMTTVSFPISNHVSYPSQTVLYLWKAHNIVNARLHQDTITEDPMFPKRQFPMGFLCPTCTTAQGEWFEYRVLNYLIQYYTAIQPSVY